MNQIQWEVIPGSGGPLLHWGDLFIVYKHNIQPELTDRWAQDQNQVIVKLTYGLAL